jgi:hypothetical protein
MESALIEKTLEALVRNCARLATFLTPLSIATTYFLRKHIPSSGRKRPPKKLSNELLTTTPTYRRKSEHLNDPRESRTTLDLPRKRRRGITIWTARHRDQC